MDDIVFTHNNDEATNMNELIMFKTAENESG